MIVYIVWTCIISLLENIQVSSAPFVPGTHHTYLKLFPGNHTPVLERYRELKKRKVVNAKRNKVSHTKYTRRLYVGWKKFGSGGYSVVTARRGGGQ